MLPTGEAVPALGQGTWQMADAANRRSQEIRMPLMAYSPIEQGRLPRSGALQTIGQKHGASPFQIALAWLLQKPWVISIPKTSSADHVRSNHQALQIGLSPEDLQVIDAEFPPPRRRRPLEML
jgi:diketogulonate reductase-like aldo/keto reductase